MIPQDALDRASQSLLDAGIKVLQGFRMAPTDVEHVQHLLDFMLPDANTLWLDIGSGFGEVARLMCEARPDLSFFLLNNNAFQAEHSPPEFRTVVHDMHELPFGDGTFDGCMLLYALCHSDDMAAVLREAARVTRDLGELFVFDYERQYGDNDLMWRHLHARAVSFGEIMALARGAGWRVTMAETPIGSDALFRSVMPDALYKSIFDDLEPILWRATKLP